MPLHRASRDSFPGRPFGHVVFGPCWLVWAASPNLIGSAAWGKPSADELSQAFELWDWLWPKLAAPLAIVTDITALEAVPDPTFSALSHYVAPRLPAMTALSTRHLVWVGPSIGAPTRALGVGFLASLGARHEHLVTHDRAVAAAWSGPAVASVLDEVAALRDAGAGVTSLLRELREAIAERLVEPAIDVAARTLGLSERTLQRRLGALGTSFRDEVTIVRCRSAAGLLSQTDRKIADIAAEVGLGSPSHFARAFKRHIGLNPNEYRDRSRGDP